MTVGIAVLGSTGSIGTSTLRVLERQRERFRVVALTAYGSADRLLRQAAEVEAQFAGLVNGEAGASSQRNARLAVGTECLIEAATHPDVGIVVNAVVGAAGLEATLAALRAGKRVALANKETLVMAGELVQAAAAEGGGEIVPVDSEHSAVLQCITGRRPVELRRLILTASGGPFREWSVDQLPSATANEALRHPTWNMGPKITVDSATLANKALEVIEAHHLFGLGYQAIEVVVHPQSIVHAFTEFVDGSVLAQVGFPTMELPILYALTHPQRVEDTGTKPFDPVAAGPLTFEPLRYDDFPAFTLGVRAGATGGTAPTVYNAGNEVAVQAFLQEKITFGAIGDVIRAVLDAHEVSPATDLETVLAADRWAREQVEELCLSR
ncbi:MAG: 1-deoxy-D-xylulose-5-phosphate reductoisomerase [Gemmatimonadales bacterium]|nr:1-deoxy-D-xylulose-5-phosphate reductoisomerase [Gemmatimonadales bacterium]NIN11678.1 1-deoxy-D-xylulose-5-phosphate reductoisomerase [Gemmatimonadales bacterium]NIN50284.1 1-deoxy-D-xylulose-5-phosphate reductoisomerase [Gemmatimonadales bacterium]NIP07748.1 1-deoxy-D-xylulose-5-phosphate reductoisomerase [Gemmatimonadales bacterium]NIQ99151.1 1-deoxy-D-xylulose-5-phosphate reductoisomerase [Gemmatimonadales bacterium]